MFSILKQASRTDCVLCNLRTNSILCDTCKSESREDFFLLLLTKLKDQGDNYSDLQAKCIDIQDAIEHYIVPETPLTIFDQNVHIVDEQAEQLLQEHTPLSTEDFVAVKVESDGDCLFHSLRTFYPMMSIDELRARCIYELCTHEQYYEMIKTEMQLDLVDDESVQEHVLRILNNYQYTGVLTLAALSTVIQKPIQSIYPGVNDNDGYSELLNTVFIPRNTESSSSETTVRIMWSGPEEEVDRIWRVNHFVPVLSVNKSTSTIETSSSIQILDNNLEHIETNKILPQMVLRPNKSTITYTNQMEDEKENRSITQDFVDVLGERYVFLEASAIIQYMINAVKEGTIFEEPPKLITHASMFTIKQTDANRLSIGKDGNGVWKQMRSVKTPFTMKDSEKYQIVRQDASGKFFYNERVGSRYVCCPVNPNQIITMHRYYATNGANPSLRRLIAYSSQGSTEDSSGKTNLPIFLQYAVSNQKEINNLQLKPHGNAKNSNRAFTSTLPSVIEQIKSQSRFIKPSTIYNSSIHNIEQVQMASLTTIRDRVQIYNSRARQKTDSSVEEYLAILKNLEKSNTVVARFSMNRDAAPVLVLSQSHMIQEIKRCCIKPPEQVPPSVLCIDTTYNLGRFFVTPMTYRNTGLQYRKTKKTPIFIGPIMIHYRNNIESYQELLDYVRRELNCTTLIIGSDGDKAIHAAVENVFPGSTHLYCTRHVRDNIERQLIKCQATQDERRILLDLIFNSPDSLIQSETLEEFQERLNDLNEHWLTIQARDETRFNGAIDFFRWFEQYQVNKFRNHLIAAVRIPINYMDRNGSPRLFYNNDAEAMNQTLKNTTNWELKSLSEIIDIISKLISTQKNETIRALYDSGELELLPPYSRFMSDIHIWTSKTTDERREIIERYYGFTPPPSKSQRELNIPKQAGRKPGRSNVRGSSTRTRKKK